MTAGLAAVGTATAGSAKTAGRQWVRRDGGGLGGGRCVGDGGMDGVLDFNNLVITGWYQQKKKKKCNK